MAYEPVITRKKVNMFEPPANLVEANSSNAPANYNPNVIQPVKDTTKTQAPMPVEYTPMQRNAMGAMAGFQAAGAIQPTESGSNAVLQTFGAGAQGAAVGAMYGGVPGAVVGGGVGFIMGGLNAYMGNQQATRERDRINALNREARRLNAEQVARDEKWRQTYRLDSLEEARYQRQKYEAQAAYERARAQGESMMAKINADAKLKERFQKMGW